MRDYSSNVLGMSTQGIKWFKHYIGMVDDEKIKALFEIHGEKGFASIMMWDKILEKAAKDGGYFRVAEGIAYDDMTLKVVFPEVGRFYGIDFILSVMKYFTDMRMIQPNALGEYYVINWEKYQSTSLSTPRVEKFRENKKQEDQIDEIILFLNKTTGKGYSLKTKTHREHIRSRLRDGYTVEQMKAVIVHKQNTWGGDPKMKNYVTPETLFRPGNFDRYLNEIPAENVSKIASAEMLTVQNAFGDILTIDQETFNRAEKGYYKIVKK